MATLTNAEKKAAKTRFRLTSQNMAIITVVAATHQRIGWSSAMYSERTQRSRIWLMVLTARDGVKGNLRRQICRSGVFPETRLGQSVRVPDISALVGSTVTQVTLDQYQLTLLFVAHATDRATRVSAHLVIEKAFEYEAAGQRFEIDPQHCETFGPTWRLLGRTVSSSEATDDLVVNVAFDDGSHFTLRPGGSYEAFNLWGEGVPGLLAGPS